MCNYKMLYHSNKGYVGECPNCQQIQLAYGTAALNFDQEQYQSFYNLLLEQQTLFKNEPHTTKKKITLATAYPGFSLMYSIAELNELLHLLSSANFEKEVQSLIASIQK